MLTRRIIPCLDVDNGRVVKGVRFSGLIDAGNPAELAAAYQEQGADEIVLLDVSATPDGRATAYKTVEAVREVLCIPLTVGGGVRTTEDARNLLEAGADKVSVNTAAVEREQILSEMADKFGRQCTILALDAARTASKANWEVVTHSGKHRPGINAVSWAKRAASLGAGEILLTSWDRDGTREGYDLELLTAVCSEINVPLIASGGASNVEHLLEAFEAGADAVLAASIFHFSEYTVKQVKEPLRSAGVNVRL